MTKERWPADRAWDWYKKTPWLFGMNYVTSTAINTTEMWQAETFDLTTIDRELSWAAGLGMNTCRVFVQYLVFEGDPKGLLTRLDQFLEAASRHGLTTMYTLFDDCAFAGKQPYLGPQDSPVPSIHNSGWTPSPGRARATDPVLWPKVEEYVRSVIEFFAHDPRVLAWDLFNEPGNSGMGNESLPLLAKSFEWARAAMPDQPITAGVWHDQLTDLNTLMVEQSDVISYHRYGTLQQMQAAVEASREFGYPIICTEWMARTLGSCWETDLPYLKAAKIGCYSWGLVSGKTQTRFPWGTLEGAPEPPVWFHDLFYPDGRPYREEEIAAIKAQTDRA